MDRSEINSTAIEPLQASALEFWGEISEDELADGLMAPLPQDLVSSELPALSPDEFETCYMWFLS